MKLPFIKYVEALIASKLYTVDQIMKKINDLDVMYSQSFPKEAIAEIYKKMQNKDPEYFKDHTSLPDLVFLEDYGIEKLVAYLKKLEIPKGVAGISGAMEIVKDKNMYRVITAMALAKINQEDIELIVNGRYNIHYMPEDIEEFLNYFFDVSEWSLTDKKRYTDAIKDPLLKKAYEYAIDGDKDYLMWKLGLAPNKSFDSMLRDMGTDSFYNFKEKGKAFPDEAQKWGNLMLRITDRLEKLDKDTTSKESIFDQLDFQIVVTKPKDPRSSDSEKSESKVPHIKDLIGGNDD